MIASASTRAGLGWMTPVLLPAINLGLALVLSAIVVLLVGEIGRASCRERVYVLV